MKPIDLSTTTPPPFLSKLPDKAQKQLAAALAMGYVEKIRRLIDDIEYEKRMEQKRNGN